MTKTELQAIESRMTEEEIMNRARTLRPVGELKDKGGKRFWLQADRIATEAYLWDPKPLCPTGILKELGSVKTYHRYCHPLLFKPSVDECIYQCPYPEATAFLIMYDGVIDKGLERHVATTVYFSGDIPQEIANRKIKW